MEYVIFAFSGLMMFLAGYLIGLYKERTDWNSLIELGKIPPPSNSKKSPVWGRHYE